jgi:Cytochrome oxidase complex assembly protein 1
MSIFPHIAAASPNGTGPFKRTRRRWAIAGLIVCITGIAGIVSIAPGLIESYKIMSLGTSLILDHPAYKLGVAGLQNSPLATNVLGTPVAPRSSGKLSLHTENTSDRNNVTLSSTATLSFPVSGPKASGTAFVEATKKNDVWSLTRLYLKLDSSEKEIDIVGSAQNTST